MTMTDLRARFWVDALRWRAESAGASVYVAHKGDPDAGVILLKTLLPERMALLSQSCCAVQRRLLPGADAFDAHPDGGCAHLLS